MGTYGELSINELLRNRRKSIKIDHLYTVTLYIRMGIFSDMLEFVEFMALTKDELINLFHTDRDSRLHVKRLICSERFIGEMKYTMSSDDIYFTKKHDAEDILFAKSVTSLELKLKKSVDWTVFTSVNKLILDIRETYLDQEFFDISDIPGSVTDLCIENSKHSAHVIINCTSKLQSLRLNGRWRGRDIDSLLSKFTRLEKLYLNEKSDAPSTIPPNLQELHCNGSGFNWLEEIQKLKHLKVLNLLLHGFYTYRPSIEYLPYESKMSLVSCESETTYHSRHYKTMTKMLSYTVIDDRQNECHACRASVRPLIQLQSE
jgi:hypothetical protein